MVGIWTRATASLEDAYKTKSWVKIKFAKILGVGLFLNEFY